MQAERITNLVLGRRVGESIMIGDDVRVEIDSVHGSTVRLRVFAPESVSVDREEVRERKQ